VGSKKSGKTTTIEALTRELSERGHRVAAVKHVSESDFTIDTRGKDTWRFAQAGARTIISVSQGEIATIERTDTMNIPIDEILQRCRDSGAIFLEGFKRIVAKNRQVFKIIVAKSADEALEATKDFEPILCFTGPYSTRSLNLKAPYVDVLENPAGIVDLIERIIAREHS